MHKFLHTLYQFSKVITKVVFLLVIFATCFLWPQLTTNQTRYKIISSTQATVERIPFEFNQEQWNRIRRHIEEGVPLEERAKVVKSTAELVLPPRPPEAMIEVAPEMRLSIRGRKVVGTTLKGIWYDYPDQYHVNRFEPTMQQELQVNIKGQIGNKVTVNVDFDDTKPDKRDISLTYKGDPQEVIQEFAFGDITLALPQTEFVGYSKQVFGIKADARYKNLKVIGIGSVSKGTPETKRFIGNTVFERKELLDTSYVRRKYFHLSFGTDTIKSGTVVVYVDDKNTANDSSTTKDLTVCDFTYSTMTYSGKFDLLVPGQDYIVDYTAGTIIFKKSIGENYVIAIDYKNQDDIFLREKIAPGNTYYIMIKDENNTEPTTREIKNCYSLGFNKIIRDNGRGNFLLKVVNPDYTSPSIINPGNKPVPTYPNNIIVDFEAGTFQIITSLKPFPDEVYARTPKSYYKILAEFYYRIKTFVLRPFIVPQSEQVKIDGRILQRDIDYFIDYDSGFITFYHEEMISETAEIEISYEYSFLGITAGETFAGGRLEYGVAKNLFIGTSHLGNIPTRPQNLPDTRNMPQSLYVGEVDFRLTDFALPYLSWLRNSFSGEYAYSLRNPNIWDRASVESMEGIKQEDTVSMSKDLWRYGSNPAGSPKNSAKALSWNNEEVKTKDINPNAKVYEEEKQQVLSIDYDLSIATVCSMVQSLSLAGIDFSKKHTLEMFIYGDNSNNLLEISVGQFNEDADNDKILDTEDTNKDNILGPGEDIGWIFNNPDGSETRLGAANTKLDSEDLDSDGIFDTVDIIPENKVFISTINWLGWKYITIPLNIILPSEWEIIKQVRLTFKGIGKSNIKIAQINFIGNKWENLSKDNLEIYAINNQGLYNYSDLVYNNDYIDLYQINKEDPQLKYRKEQALAMKYNIKVSTPEIAAKMTFTKPLDFSTHEEFRFFLYGDSNNGIFFIRVGRDDNNYFEYRVNINWSGEWRLFSIKQIDTLGGDKRADAWDTPYLKGTPSLTYITQIVVGISTPTLTSSSGEIWVNELHLYGSNKREGTAQRLNAEFRIPDWMTFGGTWWYKSRNFETFQAGITNQDRTDRSGYLNFTKLGSLWPVFSPISFKLSSSLTETPAAIQAGPLVPTLQEGKVSTISGSVDTTLNLPKLPLIGPILPTVGTSYSKSVSSSNYLLRTDITDNYSGSLSYQFPIRFFLFPTNIIGTYSETYVLVNPWTISAATPTASLEVSKTYNLTSIPFQFGTILSLNPNYYLKTVREGRMYPREVLLLSLLVQEKDAFEKTTEYDKSVSQKAGFSSSLRLLPWLSPSLNYSISIDENYNWPVSNMKSVNRSGSGSISLSLSCKDILPQAKPFQSLTITPSYNVADADYYENVESIYPIRDKICIRDYLTRERLSIFDLTSPKEYRKSSLTLKDTISTSCRWNIFEGINFTGRLSPLKKTSVDGIYTWTSDYSIITKTESQIFAITWPDVLFRTYELEKIFGIAEKYISNGYGSVKIRHEKRENVNISKTQNKATTLNYQWYSFKNYFISLNYSITFDEDVNIKQIKEKITKHQRVDDMTLEVRFPVTKWNITTRGNYKTDYTYDGDPQIFTTRVTRDVTAISLSANARIDTSFPQGLQIPLFGWALPLTNRIIFNSDFSFASKKSTTQFNENTDQYGLSLSTDYEVSPNLRATAGGGIRRYINTSPQGGAKENRTEGEISFKVVLIL